MRAMMSRPSVVDIRVAARGDSPDGTRQPLSGAWMRATSEIGTDPRAQQAVLAYSTDMTLLAAAMRSHSVDWQASGLQSASLDHAIWFHRPTDFNQWHLYSQDSPSASGGRGLVRGSMFSSRGVLVASVAQETLMRIRPRPAKPA
jgi:acyl-CoA thioesterase-2